MIRVVHDPKDRIYRVVAYCDSCGREITDAGMALFQWDTSAARRRNGTADIFIAHKGDCANGPCPPEHGWDEFSRFPLYLASNVNVDLDLERRRMIAGGGE